MILLIIMSLRTHFAKQSPHPLVVASGEVHTALAYGASVALATT